MGYMCSENRKKVQRALNKAVREVNHEIERDELWHGRFVIEQTAAWWIGSNLPHDHSLVVEFRFLDRKTGFSVTEIKNANSAMLWNGSWLFRRMNDFICVDVNVWANEGWEALKNDTTMYVRRR